jgi:branched-chain amino acid transport system ATP-binding protein
MSEPLLSIEGVSAYYGNIRALNSVSLDVQRGEIVTLIGANGAGKSTLMMTVFGMPAAREGRILFEGRNLVGLKAHEIAQLKIAQSPEGRRIFQRMTVLENLQMGAATGEPQKTSRRSDSPPTSSSRSSRPSPSSTGRA